MLLHAWIAKQLFDPHRQVLSLSFLHVKLTGNEARSTQCWFNYANVWVSFRASATAFQPGASAPCVGEVNPVVLLSNSGECSKETIQESSDSRDVTEGTKQHYTESELMYLILHL